MVTPGRFEARFVAFRAKSIDRSIYQPWYRVDVREGEFFMHRRRGGRAGGRKKNTRHRGFAVAFAHGPSLNCAPIRSGTRVIDDMNNLDIFSLKA